MVSRMFASSSTMRMLGLFFAKVFTSIPLLDRQFNRESCSFFFFAFDFDVAAVHFDEFLADCQAHTHAFSSRGEEGSEEFFHVFFRYAIACVFETNFNESFCFFG